MGLNIKNETAHKLASELAAMTGETLTDAVTKALSERLDRLKTLNEGDREQRKKDALEIIARFRAEISEPVLDHTDWLYDERGLPK